MTSDEDAHDGATILVEPAHRRAVITWAPGVPVFNPWMATMERLLSHPEFKPEFAVVSDWRAATGSPDQAFVDSFLVFCQSIRRARLNQNHRSHGVASATLGVFEVTNLMPKVSPI